MKRSSKIAVSLLVFIGILAVALLILNNFLEGKIKKSLEEKLTRANTSFEKVDVKLLDRSAEVIDAHVELRNKNFKVDTIVLNDIGIWKYLTTKNIVVGELQISNPVVKITQNKSESKDPGKDKSSGGLQEQILIKKVRVNGGSFQMFENDTASAMLFASLQKLQLNEVRIDSASLKEKVPFEYQLKHLEVDSLYFDLSEQQELVLEQLLVRDLDLQINGFKVLPKYSKAGHQQTIEVEKDWYDLVIDSISMQDFGWSVQNDSLKFENSLTHINGVNFEVYRNKLKPDDTTFKPLYSRAIRKLPFLINIDSIEISDAYIKYEERIQADRPPGMVEFANLNVSVQNITNMGLGRDDFPKTRVTANTDFMKGAPLSIDWQFDISDRNDAFQLSGQMGRLQASQMNKFTEAGLNLHISGDILEMYFNFYGDNTSAKGDMKLEYNDFKVEVLQKDGENKNKVISALANLIVRNKAVKGEQSYKEIKAQRDQTKSFWNYFWLMIKNGAFKSFI
ncbi:hypothetical protein MKO06_02140 [Gramella sp. GC03-9]|uniref:DUF748 domain-containing protein n=1 Tax=Christiangramia oceanisediminis TaxID=2920386 RepID=A0A9X2KVH0_9FLAO|nr:hypothetical protein [Gramella oceanisediminis]MCP9198690.1 hypothetical protein [Gramella oceanisediminis]